MASTLHIKNMVCNRCIMVVSNLIRDLGLNPIKVSMGEVLIGEDEITPEMQKRLDEKLLSSGFERLDDKKALLIEKIKNKVISTIHHSDSVDLKFNWSVIFSEEFNMEYNYLSQLFSAKEGITLEQYIIKQKIEKVKELLFYDELSLSEIAWKLGYSSVAHISGQFKKITGMTPSAFKNSLKSDLQRKPLDNI